MFQFNNLLLKILNCQLAVHPRIDDDEKQYILATTGRKAQTITVIIFKS